MPFMKTFFSSTQTLTNLMLSWKTSPKRSISRSIKWTKNLTNQFKWTCTNVKKKRKITLTVARKLSIIMKKRKPTMRRKTLINFLLKVIQCWDWMILSDFCIRFVFSLLGWEIFWKMLRQSDKEKNKHSENIKKVEKIKYLYKILIF